MTTTVGAMDVHPSAARSSAEPVCFTPAEVRLLPLLATYLTLGGIADRLGVRRSTIKTHVVSIYKKLGVSNRTDAVEQAEARGLLTDGTPLTVRSSESWRAP